jgi:hypothetical protein
MNHELTAERKGYRTMKNWILSALIVFLASGSIAWLLWSRALNKEVFSGQTTIGVGDSSENSGSRVQEPMLVSEASSGASGKTSEGPNIAARGSINIPGDAVESSKLLEEVHALCMTFGNSETDTVESFAKLASIVRDGYNQATPVSDEVLLAWQSKDYTRVSDIAETRLSIDNTDILGHLLKFELAMIQVDLEKYSYHSLQILGKVREYDKGHFGELLPILVAQIDKTVQTLLKTTTKEIVDYRAELKAQSDDKNSAGRLLSTALQIQALELDGVIK